jgi:hypothetical protein
MELLMPDDLATADATPQEMDSFMDSAFDEMEPIEEETPEIEASAPDVDETPADVEAQTDLEGDETPPESDTVDEEEESEPVEQTVAAPQSMSAKDREALNALPPEEMLGFVQNWLTDRAKEQESHFTQKSMELADKTKTYDRLEQVLAPRRQQLAMDGMDDSTAVGQLFALSDMANADPVGFVKQLFNARNIPLSALTESGGDVATDPQLAAMQNKLQGFENYFTQQAAQSQRQAETAINSDVEAFAKENEHYAELETEMIPVVAALRQSDPSLTNQDALAKAYKMAIAANPVVSAKIEADKSAKAEADKLKMEKARAAKAKKAAGANVRSSGALPAAATKAKDVDSFLGALYDERATA